MECKNINTVVAGAVVSCDPSILPPARSDIFDSMLYSQLYAGDKAAKFETPDEWFSEHDVAMRQLKWLLLSHETTEFSLETEQAVDLLALIKEKWLQHLPVPAANDVLQMHLGLMSTALNEKPHALFTAHTQRVSQVKTVPAEPPTGQTIRVIQLGLLAPQGILHSLYVSGTTRSAEHQGPVGESLANEQIVGKVSLRILRRQWDGRGYRRVRANVDKFLSGKRDGLILPVTCEAGAPQEYADD